MERELETSMGFEEGVETRS